MADTVEVSIDDTAFFRREAKLWWLFVVFGAVWCIFGIALLSYRAVAIETLAILLGITFVASGIVELVMATQVTSWKWLWGIYGVLSIGAGIVTFAWPDETLFVLGVLLAWFLVISGIFNFVAALAGEKYDWWWLGLLFGVLEFALGAWALGAGEVAPAILLINLAGIYALFRGFHDMFLGFSIHGAAKRLGAA